MAPLEPPRAAAPGRDHDERLDLLRRLLARHSVPVGAHVDQGLVGEAKREDPDAAADLDELVVGDLAAVLFFFFRVSFFEVREVMKVPAGSMEGNKTARLFFLVGVALEAFFSTRFRLNRLLVVELMPFISAANREQQYGRVKGNKTARLFFLVDRSNGLVHWMVHWRRSN